MDLLVWVLGKDIDKFVRDGVRLVVVGSKSRLSEKVKAAIMAAEQKSAASTRAVVALCLNYGGQTEIAEGVARMINDGVKATEVTPERIRDFLYHPELPDIDLVIRTSGEQRLSGFMMWRVQYAELYFATTPWPAFSEAELDSALAEYARRKRRFGK